MSLLFSEKTGRNNRNLSKLISEGGTIVLPGKNLEQLFRVQWKPRKNTTAHTLSWCSCSDNNYNGIRKYNKIKHVSCVIRFESTIQYNVSIVVYNHPDHDRRCAFVFL
mgnify:CR=1 FL=1